MRYLQRASVRRRCPVGISRVHSHTLNRLVALIILALVPDNTRVLAVAVALVSLLACNWPWAVAMVHVPSCAWLHVSGRFRQAVELASFTPSVPIVGHVLAPAACPTLTTM